MTKINKIPIYKAEASVDGLAEQVIASTAFSYSAQAKPWEKQDLSAIALDEKFLTAHAGLTDGDLYFTRCIMVSSLWNGNDDVFDKAQTFAARHTPSFKPTNIGHDEHEIVGHIINNWVMDNEGNTIADDSAIDDLPDVFHIATGSVIYTSWQDPAMQERAQSLIQAIEAGTMFVSMECGFSDFGYAIRSPEGKLFNLDRNESTAFLTKHLRKYGGTGQFEGHSIGRLLKNITFTAFGYVENPANKPSVIFNDKGVPFSKASSKNPFSTNSGVSFFVEDTRSQAISEEQSPMDERQLEDRAKAAEAKVEKLVDTVEAMKTEMADAGVKALKDSIADLEAQVADAIKARDEAISSKDDSEKKKKESDAKVEEVTKAHDVLQAKVEEAEAAVAKAVRVNQLVEAGMKNDDAVTKVEAFSNLDDTQWAVIAETLIAQFPPKDDDKDKKDKKDSTKSDNDDDDDDSDDKGEAAAKAAELEKAKVEEAAALAAKASDDDDDELTLARKEISKAIYDRLGVEDDSDNKDE